MSALKHGARSLSGLRCQYDGGKVLLSGRCFSSTTVACEEVTEQVNSSSPPKSSLFLEPHLAHTPRLERRLLRQKSVTPIGSRRRRAALQAKQQTPFEQLPYQCFQEARKVLKADRLEKISQIETQRTRLEKLRATEVEPQNEGIKERRITSMTGHLEELKIFADINDPLVKKRFEDGQGDMNKPIYRYLADRQWREYPRKLLMQRITQMNVVPDVLPTVDPILSVQLAFGRRNVQPGEFVDSRVSEIPATLRIQPYNRGERYVTVAVVNPDVPNVRKDGFGYRCHFLACNIKISPTQISVPLASLSKDSQIVLPWLPAYTQKGAPYSRMSIFILEQPEGNIGMDAARNKVQSEGFILRAFADRHSLKPIGVNLYRSQWDEGTSGVMQRAGVPGHDVQFKRMRVEPLPYKKLPGSRYR